MLIALLKFWVLKFLCPHFLECRRGHSRHCVRIVAPLKVAEIKYKFHEKILIRQGSSRLSSKKKFWLAYIMYVLQNLLILYYSWFLGFISFQLIVSQPPRIYSLAQPSSSLLCCWVMIQSLFLSIGLQGRIPISM